MAWQQIYYNNSRLLIYVWLQINVLKLLSSLPIRFYNHRGKSNFFGILDARFHL